MLNIHKKNQLLLLLLSLGGSGLSATWAAADSITQPFADDTTPQSDSQAFSTSEETLIRNFALDGIHLTQQQASKILNNQQQDAEIRNSSIQLLQSTNGTAHMEVSGEGRIRHDSCNAFAATCTDKYAGLYVHTPDESETLVGYRSVTTANLPGTTSSSASIATWGISTDPAVMGKLGTLTSTNLLLGGTTDRAYGVFGEASSDTQDANYGVYGTSTKSNGYGVYGQNTAGGEAGYFDGPVGQTASFGGIVKATAYVYCSSSNSTVVRSFSPKGTTVTIANGASNGTCTVDFGFPILNQNFFQVSAVSADLPRSASCGFVSGSGNNNKLSCLRINGATGSGAGGNLMITIY